MTQPTLLLFDIDGTLVTTGGAGRRALERVFGERFQRKNVFEGFAFSGMTDPAIIREGLARVGEPYSEHAMRELFDAYVGVLKDELKTTKEHRLHEGMREVILEAGKHGHIAVGLGTGNIEPGARAKLEPLGVMEHFRFGGYGSDAEDRGELIRLGAEKGASLLGVPLKECRTVIIGDTPKDIAAARHIGAEVLAVTTGSFNRDQLRHADFVCDTIADPAAWKFLLA